MTHTRVYCKGVLEAEDFPVADISDYLERPDTVVWVDYCAPSPEEMEELKHELGFHELAVEDALGPHQRPKLDHYPEHLFLSSHAVKLDHSTGRLVVAEISAFIHPRWLVTVRKDEAFGLEPVKQRWDRSPQLAADGVSYLLYGLLDVVVDGYSETVDTFDEYYDAVSDGVFSEEQPIQPAQQRHWFHTRKSLIEFHRLVVPMREAVGGLMRREQPIVTDELRPYYQDVYDHVLRVSESTDALRDLVNTLVDTNLTLRDYQTNQIVKKVTGVAAIIAVPTLITGWYGMNVPYPGLGQRWGWITAGVLIVVLSGVLYKVFKKNDWL